MTTDAEARQRARESTNLADKLSLYEGVRDLGTLRDAKRFGPKILAALDGIRLYDLEDAHSALGALVDAINDLEDDTANPERLQDVKRAIAEIERLLDLGSFFASFKVGRAGELAALEDEEGGDG